MHSRLIFEMTYKLHVLQDIIAGRTERERGGGGERECGTKRKGHPVR